MEIDKNVVLCSLGLSPQQCAIYNALLEKGVQGISRISQTTGINRPAIYKHLPTLIQKGIVSEVVKKKQKLFAAENPEKLEVMLDDMRDQFNKVLPEFMELYRGTEKNPLVKFFSGKQGISFIFEDLIRILKKGDTFYRYSAPNDLGKAEKYLPTNYRKIRDEKQLERFVITGSNIANQKTKRLERGMKVLRNIEQNEFNITQLIYANKVAFINYENQSAVLIEDSLLANFQKMLFRSLYASL